MSEFRTIVSPRANGFKMHQKSRFLTLGSCFSDAMGERLQRNKFPVLVNPFGVIYNPVSIHQLLSYACLKSTPDEHTYLKLRDIHFNYELHSGYSAANLPELKEKIKQIIFTTHDWLLKTDYIILTYGTAWVYVHKDTGLVVANCHKSPATQFEKRLLRIDEVIDSFTSIREQVHRINSSVKFLITISPVRHIRDTLELNSVSKSALRVASFELTNTFSDVEYFPAYEIAMDDLRDYRFYKPDMIHPTEQAEDYIWDIFVRQYMDTATQEFLEKWRSIRASLNHKPFHPSSSGHKNFLEDTLRKLEDLHNIVEVNDEIKKIKAQLKKFA